MAWYLFLLVVAAITAVFVWDYRRKASKREAVRRERFERIFESRSPTVSPAASSGASVPAGGSAGTAVPQARPGTTARFLGNSEKLAYLLIKTAVPDHEIFARVTLAAIIGSNGEGAEREQLRRRYAPYQLDFVVCDREMRVVAAIELETAVRADTAAERRFVADCLNASGIRLIRLNSEALPRRDELRAQVCGGASGNGTFA